MPSTKTRRQRAPNGVLSTKPIGLRLMPDELWRVELYAELEQQSVASFARLMCLFGLAAYEQEHKPH
jgi:hypothetical protein